MRDAPTWVEHVAMRLTSRPRILAWEARILRGRTDTMFGGWSPPLLSVLRIVAAFLYLQHGTAKLFAIPPAGGDATAALFSRLGTAGVIEIVGGTLMLLGLFTRPAAFLCAGEMAFAYFLAHAPRGFLPLLNQGELPVLFCFIFLYLAAAGGGPWSVDAVRTRAATSSGA